MSQITKELVRKRAEHNECEIFSLEELSLHQQDIEKIENLQNWCKHLQILYLQNNLIKKIENLGRLKKLEYVNLALNSIEKVENLQGCESLKKLDLTVNFIGEISSLQSLNSNIFLEELYLVGNPCANFDGYKDYVITTLPHLKKLDGLEIEKSERIRAFQKIDDIRKDIMIQEANYLKKREEQVQKDQCKKTEEDVDEVEDKKDEEDDEEFWNTKVEYTPETRLEMQKKLRENKNKSKPSQFSLLPEKRKRRLFNVDEKPMNVNEGKFDFVLKESPDDLNYILDVECYKFLDTSLIDVDVQPWYVRVTIKGKILQIVLYEEVNAEKSFAQRSQITGHLVVTMPRVNISQSMTTLSIDKKNKKAQSKTLESKPSTFLEVQPKKESIFDLENIVKKKDKTVKKSADLVEDISVDLNPEVPPLI